VLVARYGLQESRVALRRPMDPQRPHWLTDRWKIANANVMWSRIAAVVILALFVHTAAPRADAAIPLERARELDHSTAVFAPRPSYPYEARRQGVTGTGIILLEIEPSTGRVERASMAQSTGSPVLDRDTLLVFRRWRFKPGTPGPIKIPITFTMGGNVITEVVVKKKPMDEALERFLGKGTVLKGPIPEYPRFPPWTDKAGKGVYELRVQKDGRVSEVRILKPSGDQTFDRVAVNTLRKWRLRRGPLILELPLSFKLTPTKYSVDIPKDR
jgi:TonB family protein